MIGLGCTTRRLLHQAALVLAGTCFALPTRVSAQGVTTLPIVRRGLDELVAGRPDSAFSFWASSQAFGPDERSQLVSSVPMLKQACAKAHGYDLLRVVSVGPHIQRTFAVLLCDVRPIYLMVAAYQRDTVWGVTALNWSTDPDKILPSSVFPTQGP
jgi:hypothetical protein